jgi:hypothetical protein
MVCIAFTQFLNLEAGALDPLCEIFVHSSCSRSSIKTVMILSNSRPATSNALIDRATVDKTQRNMFRRTNWLREIHGTLAEVSAGLLEHQPGNECNSIQ